MKFIKLNLFLYLCLFSFSVQAGGPFIVSPDSGEPAAWGLEIIPIHPDTDSCGDLSNDQMVNLVSDSLSLWTDIDGIDFSFRLVTNRLDNDGSFDRFNENPLKAFDGRDTNISGANHGDFFSSTESPEGNNLFQDNINYFVFDDDGAIVDDVFGANARFSILGLAGPIGFETVDGNSFQRIIDGQALVNCTCFGSNLDVNCVEQDETAMSFTITHEIGHFLGLDHSQVFIDEIEVELVNGSPNVPNDDTGCNRNDPNDCVHLPTMFPLSINPTQQATLHKDDIEGLRSIYAAQKLEDEFCTVTGTILDSQQNSLRCVDVEALVIENDQVQSEHSISTVSGYFSNFVDEPSNSSTIGILDISEECTENCGFFKLVGLEVGRTYTLRFRPIFEGFVGASRVGPCQNVQLEPFSDGTEFIDFQTITCEEAGQIEPLNSFQLPHSGQFNDGTTANNTDPDSSGNTNSNTNNNDNTNSNDNTNNNDNGNGNNNTSNNSASSSGGGGGGCSISSNASVFSGSILLMFLSILLITKRRIKLS